jgi:hypothetical protein
MHGDNHRFDFPSETAADPLTLTDRSCSKILLAKFEVISFYFPPRLLLSPSIALNLMKPLVSIYCTIKPHCSNT